MKNQPIMGIPFIISAPSGTGKTSICKRIRSVIPDLAYSISYTTRARRKGENEGEDYFFVPLETFQKMIDEHRFLEWAQVHGQYYGTSKELVADKIDKGLDCLFDIDIKGAKRLKRIYPSGIFIFVIPPSLVELESRLSKRRTENQKEIHLRMDNALAELWAFEEYQYLIINDVFSHAVGELKSIILAERCKIEKRRPFVMELLASQVPPG